MNLHHVNLSGATTYWTAGVSHRDALFVQLDALGLAEFMPPVQGDADCLRAAVRDYCDLEAVEARKDRGKEKLPDRLVQKLHKPKKNGYQVVDVQRREDDLDLCKSFGCKVDNQGMVIVTRGHADRRAIQQFFQEHKRLVTGGAVSSALSRLAAEHLGGTILKSGLIWIADEKRSQWKQIASAFAAAAVEKGDTKVTELTYVMDDSGVDALKDAIIDEVFDSAEALKDDIAKGNLGKDALTTRQFKAAALHARVSRYETILGEALSALHETVRVAEEAAAAAIAMQEAEEVYAGVF